MIFVKEIASPVSVTVVVRNENDFLCGGVVIRYFGDIDWGKKEPEGRYKKVIWR